MSNQTYQQRGNQNSRIPVSQRRMEGGRALEDNRAAFAAKQLKQGETAQRVEEEDELLKDKPGIAKRVKDDEEKTAQATFSGQASPVQREEQPAKPNNTGLPDKLKNGIESLSGLSMDNVKVHYNSAKPQQLNALAYAQGTDIHVGPGQEKHLPHEAWHVVQQAQGRVRPTVQMKDGVPVNDDKGLEREADVMGGRIATHSTSKSIRSVTLAPRNQNSSHRQDDSGGKLNGVIQQTQAHTIYAPSPENSYENNFMQHMVCHVENMQDESANQGAKDITFIDITPFQIAEEIADCLFELELDQDPANKLWVNTIKKYQYHWYNDGELIQTGESAISFRIEYNDKTESYWAYHFGRLLSL